MSSILAHHRMTCRLVSLHQWHCRLIFTACAGESRALISIGAFHSFAIIISSVKLRIGAKRLQNGPIDSRHADQQPSASGLSRASFVDVRRKNIFACRARMRRRYRFAFSDRDYNWRANELASCYSTRIIDYIDPISCRISSIIYCI